MHLVIIQDVCCILLLLLQSPESILEFYLQVLHLTGDQSVSRMSLSLTLYSGLLAMNDDLMKKNKHRSQESRQEQDECRLIFKLDA